MSVPNVFRKKKEMPNLAAKHRDRGPRIDTVSCSAAERSAEPARELALSAQLASQASRHRPLAVVFSARAFEY